MNDEDFLWDVEKAVRVQREHGIDLREVIDVAFDEFHLFDDDPQGNWDRYMLVGQTSAGRVLQVICASESINVTRFITAFDANDYWRKQYGQA